MTRDELRAAGMAAMWKLTTWDLRQRERVLGAWVIRLSLLEGRASVWVRRLEFFSELTGIEKSDVSDALRSLASRGVLQIAGDRSGAKLYTFLPNAELVQPASRVGADVVTRMMRQIESDNAQGPVPGVAIGDVEPGGQMRDARLEPAESRLAGDFASASRERALEPDETGFIPWSAEWVHVMSARSLDNGGGSGNRSMGESPTRVGDSPTGTVGESPIAPVGDGRVRVRAPETLTCTITKEDVDVAGREGMTMTKVRFRAAPLPSAGKPELAAEALRAVWRVVPKSEFDPWQRRWVERCNAEPALVLGFAEDCADRLQRGEKIPSPGGWIFKSVAKCETMAGRPWR